VDGGAGAANRQFAVAGVEGSRGRGVDAGIEGYPAEQNEICAEQGNEQGGKTESEWAATYQGIDESDTTVIPVALDQIQT